MYKEAIKFPALLLMGLLYSCGGNSVSNQATDLLNQARACDASENYQGAITLLDSIDHAFPAAVDVRRDAMQLRPRVMEKLTIRQLEMADSVAAVDTWRLDSLSKYTRKVTNPIENYLVSSAEGHVNVSTTPGLHARMAPDGRFYLVASSPQHIGMTSLSLSSGGETVHSPSVSFDGERNDRSGALDVITYIEGECQEMGDFLLRHRNEPVTVSYIGTKTVSKPLSVAQLNSAATMFETAQLVRRRRTQELEKKRLERLLDAIRGQIARTTRDSVSQEAR